MSKISVRAGAVFCAFLFFFATFLSGCDGVAENDPDISYDFSVYIGGEIDPIFASETAADYEEETGNKVELVFPTGLSENASLERAAQGAAPVAAFFAADAESLRELREKGIVSERIRYTPIAWNFEAEGLAVDTALLAELFGIATEESAATAAEMAELLVAMRGASYAEWEDFVDKLDALIFLGEFSETPPIFSGEEFDFASGESEFIENLTGVYALAGADKEQMTETFMKSVASAVSLATIESTSIRADVYIQMLEDWTEHIAGLYAPGVRGVDFVNKEYYSISQSEKIFMEGRAVFLLTNTERFGALALLNAEKAGRLVFLPLKTPADGISTTDIFVTPEAVFAFNALVSEKERVAAKDFCDRLAAAAWEEQGALQVSAKEYFDAGVILEVHKDRGAISEWIDACYSGECGVAALLTDANFTDDERAAMLERMLAEWNV